MEIVFCRIRDVVLVIALIAAPAVAFGQTQTTTREGNIWDWRDHQPTEAQVRHEESAAGIAPTQSEIDSTSATVDRLYQELLHRSPD